MLTRVVGIGAAAAVVLVAAPSVIVKTINPNPSTPVPSSAAAIASRPTAALKIAVSGERGLVRPLYLRVRAVGPPPAYSYLRDESGLHVATVESASPGYCSTLAVHDTFAGPTEQEWCLSVTSLVAGHPLTGLLAGGTNLTLSLTRRHSFWAWPLLVLLAGLLTPLAVGFVIGALRRFAGRAALAELVNQHPEIDDLGRWAKDREHERMSYGDLRQNVERIARGPEQIRQARRLLADALAHTPVRRDHPYVVAAWVEARRTDIHVSDIVDAAAKPKVAAASDFLAHLAQLEADRGALMGLQQALEGIDNEHAYDARVALDRALEMYKRVSAPGDIPGLTQPIVDATAAIEAAAAEPEALRVESTWFNANMTTLMENVELCSAGSGGVGRTRHVLVKALAAGPTALFDALSPIRAVTTSPLDLSVEQLRWHERFWLAVTVVAAVVALAFAGATVAQKAYFANPAFAVGWDYFTLFSAALASGAAATVLGLFRYWRPQPGK